MSAVAGWFQEGCLTACSLIPRPSTLRFIPCIPIPSTKSPCILLLSVNRKSGDCNCGMEEFALNLFSRLPTTKFTGAFPSCSESDPEDRDPGTTLLQRASSPNKSVCLFLPATLLLSCSCCPSFKLTGKVSRPAPICDHPIPRPDLAHTYFQIPECCATASESRLSWPSS